MTQSEEKPVMERVSAAYGSWVSPINAQDLASASLGFSDLSVENGALYWREYRPKEGGRYALVRRGADGAEVTLTPEGYNARSRVHEYGGLSHVVAGAAVFFSNFADQHLYRLSADGGLSSFAESEGLRYADCTYDAAGQRLLCVREDHRGDGEAENTLVSLALDGSSETVLFEGTDFVAYPTPSADGKRVAWVSWDHPNMPWDNLSLWVADVDASGALTNAQKLNEGMKESILQPQWADDGSLYFISDRNNWWNLYRWDGAGISAVHERAAEFGGPLWQLGQKAYEILPNGQILIAYAVPGGKRQLAMIDPATGDLADIDLGAGEVGEFAAGDGVIYAIMNYADDLPAIVTFDLETRAMTTLKRSGERGLEEAYISQARSITFPTGDGDEAYAFYYPPTNPGFEGLDGTKPPLVVMVHGGPTSETHATFSLNKQYWTTHGFAVLDINYRGSTGYGRAYREKLYGTWGIADIEDAVNGARYAADQGLADGSKLLIRGGSAGGFVVLAAMAYHDVFAGGANYFGVSDMEALATDTHKFESRYLDQLVGPYPQMRETYIERSPIHALDGLTEPLIIFQGLEDQVVPPNQSEMIFDALKKNGVPVAYLPFEGEQHGFRKPENKKRSLEAELYFYGKILGFAPADEIDPVEIFNLPD